MRAALGPWAGRPLLPCSLLISIAILLLVGGSAADAKRIYSYRDPEGVMHFSDSAPIAATGEVSEQLIDVDPKKLVYLREEGPDADRRFFQSNGYGGPVQVLISFKEANNVVTEPALPADIVIPGLRESLVLQVQPIDEHQAWKYTLDFRHVPGDPHTKPDPNAVYRLPFPDDLRLPVHQGFGGQTSHNLPSNYHAVDIAMNEGTPVLAARAGIVMALEGDFYGAGVDESHRERANQIRILHADGTMAVYGHLALEGTLVRIGEQVNAGEHIGISGNTGYSTGPHLHFVVQRNAGARLLSVPFEFTVRGERITPAQGIYLGAPEAVE